MIATVTFDRESRITRGHVGSPGSDVYMFDLSPMHARWEYVGKLHGGGFIPVEVQGYEHIPQEFYAALDQAWTTGEPVEFPDPLFDNLEVAGA